MVTGHHLRFSHGMVAGWVLVLAAPVVAHDFSITSVVAVFKQDGSFLIDMQVDVDALAMGVSSSTPSEELAAALLALPADELERRAEQAAETLRRRVWLRFDGQKSAFEISFPQRGAEVRLIGGEPSLLGTTARLAGQVPQGAESFTFSASRAFAAVQLTILDEVAAGGVKHVVSPGAESPPYRLYEAQTEDRSGVFTRYLVLGFEHILPKGLDHILFVLGLYLLSTRLRPLLGQITAFTVAHSVTLALAMFEVASLPSRLVESFIALSIAYVAVENLFVRDLKPWRPALVFAFGLLHGMGFAGVLQELGLPAERFTTALIGFNIGVELGQIAVIVAAFLLIGWFRERWWYHRGVVIPLSAGIALVGLYWAVQRALGI
jgi:hypothetical protein